MADAAHHAPEPLPQKLVAAQQLAHGVEDAEIRIQLGGAGQVGEMEGELG